MQGEFAKTEAATQDIQPDEKAETAENDEHGDHDADVSICTVGTERGAAAENIKARVAEGADRVEYRAPQRPVPREVCKERGKQQQCADRLLQKHACRDKARHFQEPRRGFGTDGLLQDKNVPHADLGTHGRKKIHNQCDDANAAHLNEKKDHRLSECRPLRERVVHGKSRHAGCTGSSEQRIDHRYAHAVTRGERQREQKRADEYHRRKGQRNELHGG